MSRDAQEGELQACFPGLFFGGAAGLAVESGSSSD
jgi:hypothetical protein